MKKLVFSFVFVMISLLGYSQPEITFNNYINGMLIPPGSIYSQVVDVNNDGLNDVGLGYANSIGLCFGTIYGINMLPSVNITFNEELLGMRCLKTSDTVPSIQALFADSLWTLRNDSLGRKFTIFKKFLPNKPKLLAVGNISNSLTGDETVVVDSLNTVSIFHFNPYDSVRYDLLQSILITETVSRLEVEDFNRDGLKDLLVICDGDNNLFAKVKIYCQTANGLVFWKEVALDRKEIYSSRVADMFNDGFPDLIISSKESLLGGISILNFVDTNLVAAFTCLNDNPIEDFTINDFNYDGRLDIVSMINGLDSMSVYRNMEDGTMILNSKSFINLKDETKSHSLASVDYNLDGKCDIVFCTGIFTFSGKANITPFYPDLKVSDIKLNDLFFTGNNQSNTLSVKIANAGKVIANHDSLLTLKVNLRMFSVSNQILWEKEFSQQFDSILAKDSLSFCFYFDSVSIPIGSRLEVSVIADADSILNELLERNNYLVKVITPIDVTTLPDLEVSYPVMLNKLYAGDSISNTVLVTVKNLGLSVANHDSLITLRVNLRLLSDEYQDLWEKEYLEQFDSISAGDSLNFTFNFDSVSIPLGSKLIITADVDETNLIFETSKINNSSIIIFDSLDVRKFSDLAVCSADLITNLYTGNLISNTVLVKVKNIGEAVAKHDSLLTAKVYLKMRSGDDQILWEKEFSQQFDSIPIGDSLNFSFAFDSVAIPIGSKLEVYALVDADSVLEESSRLNNSLTKIFDSLDLSRLPDLIVSELIVLDSTYGQLEQKKVKIGVRNNGCCEVVGEIKIKAYLSLFLHDTIIFEGIADTTINGLSDPGEDYYFYYRPNYLTADSISIKVFIDYDSVLIESNENNNWLEYHSNLSGFAGLSDYPESNIDKISIYPNPTRGELVIESPVPINNIEVFNINGKKVMNSQSSKINLSGLPEGTYLIMIKGEKSSFSKKIIKIN